MRLRQRTPTDPNSPLKSDQQRHRGDSLPILLLLLLLLLLLPWRLNPHNNLVSSLIGKKLSIQPSTSKYLVSKHRPPIATVLSSLPTRWSARAIKSFAMAELEARKFKYPNTGTESLLMGNMVEANAMVRKEIQDETDRVTGKSKQISPIPIHLSIFLPKWFAKILFPKEKVLTFAEAAVLSITQHAAVAVDEKVYGVGGSCNGRYLSDVQVFDLKSLVWSNLKLKPNADKFEETSSLDILPAISGHNVVNWGNKLFLIGGHSKKVADKITVLFIDLETHLCSVVETSGKVPADTSSYLLIFGGCSHSIFFNNLHVLDLQTVSFIGRIFYTYFLGPN